MKNKDYSKTNNRSVFPRSSNPFEKGFKEIAIVYMVAGISSRFGGKIKQFAQIGHDNETLMEYSLNQALKAGFSKIIFIVGNLTEKPFKEKFGNNYKGIPIKYVLQTYNSETRDRPWGTADALCTINSVIDCPFVICNGDDIYGENTFKILFNHLKNSEEEATIGYKLCEVIPETGKIHRGIFKIDDNECVIDLTEVFNIEKCNLQATNSKPEDLCSMNIFALHPKTISYLEKNMKVFKKKNKEDRRIEFLLPTEISNLIKDNKIKMKVYPTPDKWFGITNPEDEIVVREMLKKK